MPDSFNIRETFSRMYTEDVSGRNFRQATRIKYDAGQIFDELHRFVRNGTYFRRHNQNVDGKGYDTSNGRISGVYLSGVHNKLVRLKFYDKLYRCVLSAYFEATNYETLSTLSIDSSFVHNSLGVSLPDMPLSDRNKHYANRPGFKMNVIVDNMRTPISLLFGSSIDSDVTSVIPLFKSLFINEKTRLEKCKTILMDTGYENVINVDFLTGIGLDVCCGHNKGNSNLAHDIEEATVDEFNLYKQRGKVENSFAILKNYPCLTDNKEKSIHSYRGLCLFIMSLVLAKRINNFVAEKNDPRLAEIRMEETLKKRDNNLKRKSERKQIKNDMSEKRRLATEERKIKTKEINATVDELICSNVDWTVAETVYAAYEEQNECKDDHIIPCDGDDDNDDDDDDNDDDDNDDDNGDDSGDGDEHGNGDGGEHVNGDGNEHNNGDSNGDNNEHKKEKKRGSNNGKTKHKRKKRLSYSSFKKKIASLLCKHVRNNILKKIASYKFAEKVLYIAIIKAQSYRNEKIKQTFMSFEWNKFVEIQSCAIFADLGT